MYHTIQDTGLKVDVVDDNKESVSEVLKKLDKEKVKAPVK